MSRWWKKKEKPSKPSTGYQPTGDTVSWDIAMSQAITALDHSASLAIKTKSSEGMREVAIGWLAVANTISESVTEEGDVHDLDSSDEYRIGFRAPSPTDEYEGEEEYEDGESHHFPTSRSRRFRTQG